MKDVIFGKQVDVVKLHIELKNAGFDLVGVTTTSEGKTIIHLADNETKDPLTIAEKHVIQIPKEYVGYHNEPLTNEELKMRVSDIELVLADLLTKK